MGRLSKTARGSVVTRRETTSARIEGLLKDPIGVLNNTHKPIIGWLCCCTPQKIILTAGLTPYRTILEPTSDMTDSWCFKNGIIRGSHEAISKGIFTKAGKLRMERPIAMTGGMTRNRGIVDAVRRLQKNEIQVHRKPQIAGALGATLSAFRFPSDSTAYRGERRGRT